MLNDKVTPHIIITIAVGAVAMGLWLLPIN